MREPNGIRHEQWDFCQRCGQEYYLSQMQIQKGLRLCIKNCIDNLDVERRESRIARVLTQSARAYGEMSDRRPLAFAFYRPDRWEQS